MRPRTALANTASSRRSLLHSHRCSSSTNSRILPAWSVSRQRSLPTGQYKPFTGSLSPVSGTRCAVTSVADDGRVAAVTLDVVAADYEQQQQQQEDDQNHHQQQQQQVEELLETPDLSASGHSSSSSSSSSSSVSNNAQQAGNEPLPLADLLSLLHVPPAAAAAAEDDMVKHLRSLLPGATDVLDHIFQTPSSSSSSSDRSLSQQVHHWLLPQLLAEERPPMLIAATAAGSSGIAADSRDMLTAAVRSVLLAAAADMAAAEGGGAFDTTAAAAAAADDDATSTITAAEEEQDKVNALVAADEHQDRGPSSSSGDSGSSSTITMSGGWSTSTAAADHVPERLPWEEEEEEPAVAAAAVEISASVRDDLDQNDDNVISDQISQQQQQQQQQQEKQEASSDQEDCQDTAAAAAAAQPVMLLLCHDQAAAAAAAAQYKDLLSAAAVRTALLSGDLAAAAAAAYKELKDAQRATERTVALQQQQQQQLENILQQLQEQKSAVLAADGWQQRLQQQWQQLQQVSGSTAAELLAMQQAVMECTVNFVWQEQPTCILELFTVMTMHCQHTAAAAAEGGALSSWRALVDGQLALGTTEAGVRGLLERLAAAVEKQQSTSAELHQQHDQQRQQQQGAEEEIMQQQQQGVEEQQQQQEEETMQQQAEEELHEQLDEQQQQQHDEMQQKQQQQQEQEEQLNTKSLFVDESNPLLDLLYEENCLTLLLAERQIALLQQELDALEQQQQEWQAAAAAAVQEAESKLLEILQQISCDRDLADADLLITSAADLADLIRSQVEVDQSVIDLSYLRWFIVLPPEQPAAAAAAASENHTVESVEHAFWSPLQYMAQHLPGPVAAAAGSSFRSVSDAMLYFDSPDMSQAARLVVISQGPSPGLYNHVNRLAAAMHQEMHMSRLSITTAAAAADQTDIGSSSSSSSSRQIVHCHLLPADWPQSVDLCHLATQLQQALNRVLENDEKTRKQQKKSKMIKMFNTGISQWSVPADVLRNIWKLVSWFSLLQLQGSKCQPQPPKQLTWKQRFDPQLQQQQRELVVVVQECKENHRKRYNEAGDVYMKLLRKAAANCYPAVHVTEFRYSSSSTGSSSARQCAVLTREPVAQPAYRPDLDPSRPDDLKFEFPDEARLLLDKQLPDLEQQQQRLQQLAAARGIVSSSIEDDDVAEQQQPSSTHNSSNENKKRRMGMSKAAYEQLQQHLQKISAQNAGDAGHAALQAERAAFPAAAARKDCLRLLRKNQVLVITGSTGCGKSTQIPQFILEDAIDAGKIAKTNIVVTQPRRLITTALSGRVAAERGERMGDVVGYSIHGNRRTSQITRLTFCTTGILIRRLMVDPMLSNVSHVILDEVHERGIEVDFLLTAISQLAAVRPDLKIILMSATVNAGNIVKYFEAAVTGSVASYHIPGYTYLVDEFYLEDLTEALMHAATANPAAMHDNAPQCTDNARNAVSSTAACIQAAKAAAAAAVVSGAAAHIIEQLPREFRVATSRQTGPLNYQQEQRLLGYQVDPADLKQYSAATAMQLQQWSHAVSSGDHSIANAQHLTAVVAAVRFVVNTSVEQGAILVFLPGWQSIAEVFGAISADPELVDRLLIFPLHSMLEMAEQQEVFQPAPPGMHKVILATNIAESSITFSDVTTVIDSCRVTVASFDPVNNMPRLGPQWSSQASLHQRRGRAGRVRRGLAIHLIPKKMADHHITSFDQPEIQRVPLTDTCLLVRSLGFRDIAGFLAAAPDPPPAAAVAAAVAELQQLWALDRQQELTPLGRLLALLPGDIKMTRMVIFAALLGVLDPVLTIAAAAAANSDLMRLPSAATISEITGSGSSSDDGTDNKQPESAVKGIKKNSKGGSNTTSSSSSSSSSSRASKAAWLQQAKNLVEQQKKKLAPHAKSDVDVTLAIFREYNQIMNTPNLYGRGRAPDWIIRQKLRQGFLSERVLASVRKERLQYTQLLHRAGFLRLRSRLDQIVDDPLISVTESGSGVQQQQVADLFADDEDLNLLHDLSDDRQRQQQRTALDWLFGEFTDAAAGPDSWKDAEESTDSSSSSSSKVGSSSSSSRVGSSSSSKVGSNSGSSSNITGDSSSSSSSSSSSGSQIADKSNQAASSDLATTTMSAASALAAANAAVAAAEAAIAAATAAPKAPAAASFTPTAAATDLSSSDLRRLIDQYSWNADHDDLLHAALAAGLYPNFAFVRLRKKNLASRPPEELRTKLLKGNAASRHVSYKNPESGSVVPHSRSVMKAVLPQYQWVVFTSKVLNTESKNTNLLGVTAVPDLTALLFDAGLQYWVSPNTAAAAAAGSNTVATADDDDDGDHDHDLDHSQQQISDCSDKEQEGRSSDDHSSSSSRGSSSQAAAEALLFQGFAQYKFQNPDDLTAILQLRSHLQLLLQMKVAGLSAAEVFEASRSFSELLLQLLQMTSEHCGNQDLARLHQQQQEARADARVDADAAVEGSSEDEDFEAAAATD